MTDSLGDKSSDRPRLLSRTPSPSPKETKVASQVKLPPDVKREIEVFASLTGRSQSELLAASWREYRERHSNEFWEGLRWAQNALADPSVAAVHASGMSEDQLREMSEAFTGDPETVHGEARVGEHSEST